MTALPRGRAPRSRFLGMSRNAPLKETASCSHPKIPLKLVQSEYVFLIFASRRMRCHKWACGFRFLAFVQGHILVPRSRAPFGQHQESRPLAWPLANLWPDLASHADVLRLVTRSSLRTRDKPKNVCVGGYAWSNDIPVLNGFVNRIDWDMMGSRLRPGPGCSKAG